MENFLAGGRPAGDSDDDSDDDFGEFKAPPSYRSRQPIHNNAQLPKVMHTHNFKKVEICEII